MSADVEVVDIPERSRFEIRTGGRLTGFATYRTQSDRITFLHTEIDDDVEGQGLGSTLVRAALDAVRARGVVVVPACPFVRSWIDAHPDYTDLVR